ncbi:hypothetical protein CKO44_05540 [Rubrivivax gelatinosus]|uniref:hypothetical protein n=1 Tax=Rubrivivax gelatinosus TaxID=28068 RepID=UPI0019081E26|nr:hypothetical protein [Rubrivivax gelatinosus]MBK1612933.1 hypothetical protein [Rubrivivax gelatinosus]
MSRLLARLDHELAGCRDPLRRAELLAERGCHLARVGDRAGAQRIAAELRQDHGDGRASRIAVRIMLLEGLMLFFDNLDPAATDRILRAHTVALAWRHDDLIRLTAAWLAHMQFVLGDYAAMARALEPCFDRPGACREASSRVCVVLGNAHQIAGQGEAARPWYDRARHEAAELGDDATIGALVYNRPALSLITLRLDALRGRLDAGALQFAAMGIESAYAYCLGAQQYSLMQLLLVSRARVAMLGGDAAAAVTQFDALLQPADLRFGFHADRLMLEIERAACLQAAGREAEARSALDALDPALHMQLALEDQLLFLLQHAALSQALGCPARAAAWAAALAEVQGRYDSEIDRLKVALAGLQPARLA